MMEMVNVRPDCVASLLAFDRAKSGYDHKREVIIII